MGAYQCKKCGIPLKFYEYTGTANSFSCRIHNCGPDYICMDCDGNGNCRHMFIWKWFCLLLKKKIVK